MTMPSATFLNQSSTKPLRWLVTLCIVLCVHELSHAQDEFKPNQTKLPVPPPSQALILFDGKLNRFASKTGGEIDWPSENAELISTRGMGRSNHIVSKIHFRDADIHVEFKLPMKGSGNSGLYIHGNYEIQIINSFGKQSLGIGDCGGLYGFHKPQANACRKPGEWQVLDVRYTAPRRGARGAIQTEGKITAWLNGQLVLDSVRFGEPRSKYHPYRYRTTDYLKAIWEKQKKTMVGPLFLQDHDNAVAFRNVWIQPLDKKFEMYKPEMQKPGEKKVKNEE